MAGSMNKATIVGHLGADPEARNSGSGEMIVTLRVATSESWKDKATGERKSRTQWHRVVIFNENVGKIAVEYAKQGSLVGIEAPMETREFTDRDGNKRQVTELVIRQFRGEFTLFNSAPAGDDAREARQPNSSATQNRAQPAQQQQQRQQPAQQQQQRQPQQDVVDEFSDVDGYEAPF